MKKLGLILILFTLNVIIANAQTTKVNSLLKLAAQGKISEVKKQLPALQAEYPNEPGVKLVQAVIMDDGLKALEIYKSIVKEFPNSEFADDAIWRVVQFYAVIGDTAQAKKELEYFRKKYPNSEFLAAASDAVKLAIGSLKYDYKEKMANGSKNEENKEVHAEAKKESPKSVSEHWGLQVGIYSTKAAAESEKKRFLEMKLRTDIKEKELNGEKKWAVVIGDYSSKESAEKEKANIEKKCKCSPIVYKK